MEYPISDFKDFIADWSKDMNLSDRDAAEWARSDAFNEAGKWTDGRFSIPGINEFLEAVKAYRRVYREERK